MNNQSEEEKFLQQQKDHKDLIKGFIKTLTTELLRRGETHDNSKLEQPEKDIFIKYSSKLKNTTYGSEQYKDYLKSMQVGLDHHYANNRHHPEYHKNGIQDMNIIDLIEMLCDWFASTKRHDDGDIIKSIQHNQKRFGYSDDIKKLLLNTLSILE